MKTLCLFVLLVISAHSIGAQGISEPKAKAALGQPHILVAPSSLKSPNHHQIYSYNGFLIELARAPRPVHLLSLRNPVDPPSEGKNLIRFPVRNRPVGLKLFSLDF